MRQIILQAAAIVIPVLSTAACERKQDSPTLLWQQDAYVWQRLWTPAVLTAVTNQIFDMGASEKDRYDNAAVDSQRTDRKLLTPLLGDPVEIRMLAAFTTRESTGADN